MGYRSKKNHAANQRHWENKMGEWEGYLWATQLEEFPTSRRMSIQEVYEWADKPMDAAKRAARWSGIALAMQYPVVVFYGLGDSHRLRGFRFGTDGHEYMSGFGSLED